MAAVYSAQFIGSDAVFSSNTQDIATGNTIDFTVIEGSDIISTTIALVITTQVSSVESSDILSAAVFVSANVSSSLTEVGDTLTSSLLTIAGAATVTVSILEESDTITSTIITVADVIDIQSNLQELSDSVVSQLSLSINISAQLTESSDYSTLTITYTLNTGGEMLNADGDHEFDHAPLASLDYGFDWASSGWLASGETIATSTWTVESPLVASLEQIAGGITSLFVTGGVAGNIYKITNTITTSLTRTDSRTIKLSCKQR